MGNRYVTGRLAADPEEQAAGSIQIVKLTVLENTYERRGDDRIEGAAPLAHNVEAKFTLGANAAATLRKGDAVIVVGIERDASFEGRDGLVYRRVIDAIHIGADLSHATAHITRDPRRDDQEHHGGGATASPHHRPRQPRPIPFPAGAVVCLPENGSHALGTRARHPRG